MKSGDDDNKLIRSASALRKAVGLIGIFFPVALASGGYFCCHLTFIQVSISHYYHTCMHDLFVGALCAIALFLFFYKGYDDKDIWSCLDNWVGNIAAVCALGIAWIPSEGVGFCCWSGSIHAICGAFFFLLLAFYSLFLFTRTDKPSSHKSAKTRRNAVYNICGTIIVCSLASMGLFYLTDIHCCPNSKLVFWAETAALVAFGISWLTKGGCIFPDEKKPSTESLI